MTVFLLLRNDSIRASSSPGPEHTKESSDSFVHVPGQVLSGGGSGGARPGGHAALVLPTGEAGDTVHGRVLSAGGFSIIG